MFPMLVFECLVCTCGIVRIQKYEMRLEAYANVEKQPKMAIH